jgi:uncharacterized protein with LGFP repeats
MLALAAAACSSAAAPDQGMKSVRYSANPATVLVTNSTSVSLVVGGYPSFNPPFPQPLGGALRLGSVSSGSSRCFAIPDSLISVGTNVSTGRVDTVVWTSAEPLTLTGMDTTAIVETGGQTAAFTPSSSAGWKVTLPAEGTGPTQAVRCTP